METKLLKKENIDEIAALLLKGEVVGFPTETVFGLGVIYDSEEAFNKMMIAKNRPPHKPFTLMCGSIEMLKKYVEVDENVERVINKFMPGPLTLLLSIKKELPYFVTLGSKFVGVRIPDYKLAQDIINKVGKPLLVPSANKSGEPPLSLYQEVMAKFDGEIAGVVNENAIGGKPSTIVSISDKIELVRQGSLALEEIENIWRNK